MLKKAVKPMLIDDLRELAGDEVARKIAAKYGGTRPRIPTNEQLDLLEQRNREIRELYFQGNKSIHWLQNEYCMSHSTITKILNAAQP